MRRIIANITITLLLAVPVFSLITPLLPIEQERLSLAYQLAFPGDFQDQQDDSNSTKDSEIDQDSDIVMEKYSLLQLPVRLKQNESRQARLFREHHREVVTPPPKS